MFGSDRDGRMAFYEKTVSTGSGDRKVVGFDDISPALFGWSTDGASVIYGRVDPGTKWNVYRVRVSGSAAPEPLVTGPGVEIGAEESPSGGWIAFMSDETGRLELFVQSLAPSRTKLPVSTGGVQSAWWSADGKQLLLLKGDQTMWRVPVALNAAAPRIGAPEQLGTFPTVVALDLAPSGDRFLALVPERDGPAP